jgi:pantoate--beta-alanine ligase
MQVLRTVGEARAALETLRAAGKKIALVPTMGCLHEGHLSLVSVAQRHADAVVVSIFVNPTQFGPNEDFAAYPRTEGDDLAACERAGVAAVFLPSPAEMFPDGFSTYVNEERLSSGLCGEFRPGHFRGVTTVVLLLLNIVRPDVAVFGQKDAQQFAVLRKMCADLRVPSRLVVAPVSREADGLARSSRNRYLSPEERRDAPELFAALNAGVAAATGGGSGGSGGAPSSEVTGAVAAHLAKFPRFRVQYVELVHAETLRPVWKIVPADSGKRLLAAAVFLGTTRLIDNVVF